MWYGAARRRGKLWAAAVLLIFVILFINNKDQKMDNLTSFVHIGYALFFKLTTYPYTKISQNNHYQDTIFYEKNQMCDLCPVVEI